jgi:tetratricopeptide (TPR) repeat protein
MAVPFAVAAAAAYGQRYMKNRFLKLISELINSAASGRHSGKGHKFIRQGKYEDALRHYELALEYEIRGKIGPNPATVECVARTDARLGNAEQALSAAEKSYDLYKKLNTVKNFNLNSMARMERFLAALKTGNQDELNKILSI